MKKQSLMPRAPVPALDLPLVAGGRLKLGEAPAEQFDMLVFYRGMHCPICAKYLTELEGMSSEFQRRGVRLTAISTDGQERAKQMADKIEANGVQVAYGLTIEQAREWGLYISTSRGKTSIGLDEPEHFNEPGLFLVKPDGTLYYAAVQTMPFARPSFHDLVGAIDFAVSKDYPARGEA